jgi:alpha-glucosidase (family GH31 glycosyl hydrolase)
MIKIFRNTLIISFCFLSQFTNAQNITSERPPIIPFWAFGHWVWEDEVNTRNAVETLVNGYMKYNIPVSAVIMDSPWMNSYNDFEPDSIRYPALLNMIELLQHKGIRVLGFYTGCINSTTTDTRQGKCKNFDYVVNNNYAINNNSESKWWKGKGVHYDPTSEKAKAWWHTQIEALHAMNFNGAKIDFGFAWFGDTVATSKGLMPRRAFGYQYYGDVFDYHTARNEEFVAMTYAWSGRGLMGFPSKSHVNWVGDFQGDWKGIKDQLKNIYLSANYGFSGVGCEIGGYWNVPSNKEQFIRYTQLSSLCPVMINGGSLGAFAHHLPWNFDGETVSIYQKYVGLHYELSYYLFSTAVDAHLKQATILKNCSIEKESHLLGDQLFIKVISDSLPEAIIQLPGTGSWIDFWTDSVYTSGSLVKKEYSLNQYPIFIKSGTILPLKVSNSLWQHGNENDKTKLTFLIYPDSISRYVFHKPVGSGIKYTDILVSVDKASGKISVDSEISDEYVFLVKCAHPPKRIKNADNWNYDAKERILRIEKSGKRFELKLQN